MGGRTWKYWASSGPVFMRRVRTSTNQELEIYLFGISVKNKWINKFIFWKLKGPFPILSRLCGWRAINRARRTVNRSHSHSSHAFKHLLTAFFLFFFYFYFFLQQGDYLLRQHLCSAESLLLCGIRTARGSRCNTRYPFIDTRSASVREVIFRAVIINHFFKI